MPHSSAKIAPSTNIIGTSNPSATAATWIAHPTAYAHGRRSSPATTRQAAARPSPIASEVPTPTSATVTSTGVVSPSVIDSSVRIAAHMPRRGDLPRSASSGSGAGWLIARPAAAWPGPRRR